MAKYEKSKDTQDIQDDAQPEAQPEVAQSEVQPEQVPQQADAKPATVIFDAPSVPMPVENQQALHDATVLNPNAALQPGRDVVPAHSGVVGEIESAAIKAEAEGDHALAGSLNQLLIKLGEVFHHLVAAEQALGDRIKPHFAKVVALFKK